MRDDCMPTKDSSGCSLEWDQRIWAAEICWANFCKVVFYGKHIWPSCCEWIVPGTVTDIERARC